MDIYSILSSDKDPYKLMGDIIRVLAMYKRLWFFEVVNEVNSLRLTLKEEEVSSEDVSKALEQLLITGLLRGEIKDRSSFSGVVREYLVELNIPGDAYDIIRADKRLNAYLREKYDALREVFNK